MLVNVYAIMVTLMISPMRCVEPVIVYVRPVMVQIVLIVYLVNFMIIEYFFIQPINVFVLKDILII